MDPAVQGATLNNSGTYNIASDGSGLLYAYNGTDAFNNMGTLEKTAGTGTTSTSLALSNTGTVLAQAGTLSPASVAQLSGGTLTGGTWDVLNGATLTLNNGTLNRHEQRRRDPEWGRLQVQATSPAS